MKIHQWQIRKKEFSLVDDSRGKKLALKYIRERNKILDVGCGDCSFFDIISKSRNNCKFYGYDIVKEALELCRKKGYTHVDSLQNVKIKFNVITLFECFEHFDFGGRARLAQKIDKMLSSDGLVIISFPHVKSVLSMQHYFDNPEHKIPYPSETNLLKIFSDYSVVDKIYFNPWLNPLKVIHCILTGLTFNAIYNNVCYVLRRKNEGFKIQSGI